VKSDPTPQTPRSAPDAAAAATEAAAPRSRDRAATEERILAAVGQVLARDGFGAIGVNAIAREAGVDKVLIYRYFGGLPELLRLGRQRPLLAPGGRSAGRRSRPAALPLAERYARFFEPLHRRAARAAR
jgi:hypothetical protein